LNAIGRAEGRSSSRRRLAPAIINSTSPDLRAFRKLGGKLLMYHGWDDPRVNPQNSIDTPGSGALTRPLCPHPQVAQWTGKGSTNDAANFVCASPRGGGDGDERDEDD
jgi:hypothetical protein